MITNVGLILAIIMFFVLKLLYNLFIIIIVIALVGRIKAKGKEVLKEKMGKGDVNNGEKR